MDEKRLREGLDVGIREREGGEKEKWGGKQVGEIEREIDR
jgi:hypothetical protein